MRSILCARLKAATLEYCAERTRRRLDALGRAELERCGTGNEARRRFATGRQSRGAALGNRRRSLTCYLLPDNARGTVERVARLAGHTPKFSVRRSHCRAAERRARPAMGH